MRVDHPQLNKRDRRAEPSFWVEEPTDDALSLLENALRGDEPALRRDEQADEAHSLIEENARLRELFCPSYLTSFAKTAFTKGNV